MDSNCPRKIPYVSLQTVQLFEVIKELLSLKLGFETEVHGGSFQFMLLQLERVALQGILSFFMINSNIAKLQRRNLKKIQSILILGDLVSKRNVSVLRRWKRETLK